ncbi:NAD(P)/FAD-dependent oxidoreductase [Salinicola avicenniae]|uniref:NAD(P)/FAD-dependent oxidoreductase n=1 Tax=Salinicola avicenniae TaxID=2916836 RepID=UPI0020743EDC|nr:MULTISPECIES: FAD-dependent oxidoreductase [unclassified Salinicola]
METQASVAVIGGGIVGSCTALSLQARGFRVTLFAPAVTREMTSYGNAGVITHASVIPLNIPGVLGKLPRYLFNRDPALRIAPQFLPRVAPWLLRFMRDCEPASVARRAKALDQLIRPALAAHRRWAHAAHAEALFHERGWTKLYRHPQAYERTHGERQLWGENGVAFEPLEGEALESIFDGASRHYSLGMRIPDTAHVDSPGALVACYRALFVARGGEWREGSVAGVEPVTGGYRVAGHADTFAQAVICAGPWSNELVRPLGYRLPMAFERGYHQEFALDAGQQLNMPFHDVEGAFVCTPMNDGVRVLTGIEFAHRDARPTPHQLRRVLPQVREVLKLEAPRGEPWLGRRPSLPDGLPVIGAAPRHPGLWFGFGHGHIGLSTGAVTGEWLAEALVSGEEAPSRAAFSPSRWLGAGAD